MIGVNGKRKRVEGRKERWLSETPSGKDLPYHTDLCAHKTTSTTQQKFHYFNEAKRKSKKDHETAMHRAIQSIQKE